MSFSVITALEILGTVAFAASGALTAIKKDMDIFGVSVLGLLTAVGGGIIRDIILGITPPTVFRNPLYAIVGIVTSIITFLPFVRAALNRSRRAGEIIMLIMDTAGLGAFTVAGIQTARNSSDENGTFLLIFVGVVTGVGGGILRDICAGITPYIFIKHFYACASIIGAVICVVMWDITGENIAMLSGAAAVIVIRFLAARFHWSLPKAHIDS